MNLLRTIVCALFLAGGASVAWAQANAPGDQAFCQKYADTAAKVVQRALDLDSACFDPAKGMHVETKAHFDWCMRTPVKEVRGALKNIRQLSKACIQQAKNKPGAKPKQGIVSLYTRSNGNLCMGAVAGMLNVGILTSCSKPPARIRLDARAKRIRAGDEPKKCLSYALGTFAEISDLHVGGCNRVKVDLVYDPSTLQVRSGNYCVGVEGPIAEFSKLKMQECSPTATGQKWVLGDTVAPPFKP